MNDQAGDEQICLRRRECCGIEGDAGTTIRVTEGEVWITRHHDTRDYLLAAGDSLEHTGSGRTLISAIGAARIQVQRPPAARIRALVRRYLPLRWAPA